MAMGEPVSTVHALVSQDATAWSCAHNHSSPRITELAKAGKLIATKRRRPTRTGSAATVFALPEFS